MYNVSYVPSYFLTSKVSISKTKYLRKYCAFYREYANSELPLEYQGILQEPGPRLSS